MPWKRWNDRRQGAWRHHTTATVPPGDTEPGSWDIRLQPVISRLMKTFCTKYISVTKSSIPGKHRAWAFFKKR